MDYSSKRPHWMPLRSATNTKISEKRVQPGTSNLYQIKLKVSVLSICLFYVQFIMSFSNVRICLIYLHSTIFLPQDNSRGLPTDTGTPDPGWLLLWLEQHRSCSTITHLKHTHAFFFFFFKSLYQPTKILQLHVPATKKLYALWYIHFPNNSPAVCCNYLQLTLWFPHD